MSKLHRFLACVAGTVMPVNAPGFSEEITLKAKGWIRSLPRYRQCPQQGNGQIKALQQEQCCQVQEQVMQGD